MRKTEVAKESSTMHSFRPPARLSDGNGQMMASDGRRFGLGSERQGTGCYRALPKGNMDQQD